jgi:outer membrane protein assembly factor BamE (lipoprotein component of BamABCDE complex)
MLAAVFVSEGLHADRTHLQDVVVGMSYEDVVGLLGTMYDEREPVDHYDFSESRVTPASDASRESVCTWRISWSQDTFSVVFDETGAVIAIVSE